MAPKVEFIITKKEWESSYKKWCKITDLLEVGEFSAARRAFHSACGYCHAFLEAAKEIDDELPDSIAYMTVLDTCKGCPLAARKLCINDFHEQAVTTRKKDEPPDVKSTLPYWKLWEMFSGDKKEMQAVQGKMFVIARKMRDAIKLDEGIAVERRKR